MKKLLVLILLPAFIIQLIPGCSKDKDAGEQYFKGVINGQAFECSNIAANKPEPIPGSGTDPNLRITGEWPSYTIKLMLLNQGKVSEGSFVFEGSKSYSATVWKNNTDAYYAGDEGIFGTGQLIGSGRITITSLTKNHVKGNFEFTAVSAGVGTITVTNGEFSMSRK